MAKIDKINFDDAKKSQFEGGLFYASVTADLKHVPSGTIVTEHPEDALVYALEWVDEDVDWDKTVPGVGGRPPSTIVLKETANVEDAQVHLYKVNARVRKMRIGKDTFVTTTVGNGTVELAFTVKSWHEMMEGGGAGGLISDLIHYGFGAVRLVIAGGVAAVLGVLGLVWFTGTGIGAENLKTRRLYHGTIMPGLNTLPKGTLLTTSAEHAFTYGIMWEVDDVDWNLSRTVDGVNTPPYSIVFKEGVNVKDSAVYIYVFDEGVLLNNGGVCNSWVKTLPVDVEPIEVIRIPSWMDVMKRRSGVNQYQIPELANYSMEALDRDDDSLSYKDFIKVQWAVKGNWKVKPKGNYHSIMDVYDGYFNEANVKIDRDMVKRVLAYVHRFETKNEDHINFLGSNLIGVYRVRYAEASDEVEWIEEVLQIDRWDELTVDYRDQEAVNPDFKVTGCPVNMSYLYLAHRIMTSTTLTSKEKDLGQKAVWKMLNLKFLTSLLWRSWSYGAQEAISMAVYESLSKKSMLKRFGSWGDMLNYRAEVLASENTIHHEYLKRFSPDVRLIYALSDIQTRIRKLVVKLNRSYYELAEKDARVMSESSMLTIEGETTIRESINDVSALSASIVNVTRSKHSFIKDALVEQTMVIVPTVQERHVMELLLFMVDNINETKRFNVQEMIHILCRYVVEYYSKNGKNGDTMVELMASLRNLFRSSQLTNPDVTLVKNEMERIADSSELRTKSKSITAPARMAALVYLTLRILTAGHYQ